MNAFKPTIAAGIQIGSAKIFFHKATYEQLQKWRSITRTLTTINIQRYYRGYKVKSNYLRCRSATNI